MNKLLWSQGTQASVSHVFDDCGPVIMQRYNYGGNELIRIFNEAHLSGEEDDEPKSENEIMRSALMMSRQEAEAVIKWLQAIVPSMEYAKNDLPEPFAPLTVIK